MIETIDRPLSEVAAEIRTVWAEAKAHQTAAWDAYFTTGRLLIDARSRFTSDRDYGLWFAMQRFGFSTEWGRRLRAVAANEASIRASVAIAVATGAEPPGVNAALALVSGRQISTGSTYGPAVTAEEVERRFAEARTRLGDLSVLLSYYLGTNDITGIDRIGREAERLELEWAAFVLRLRHDLDRAVDAVPAKFRGLIDDILALSDSEAIVFSVAMLGGGRA